MSERPYHPEDHTQPAGSSHAPQGQHHQDKLILRGPSSHTPSNDQTKSSSQRRPYQYSSSEKEQRQQPYEPRYAQRHPEPSRADIPPTLAVPPAPKQHHSVRPQAGQIMEPRITPRRRPRQRRGCLIAGIVVLLLACILGSMIISTTQRVLAFGSTISTQTPLSSQNNYMNTDQRTNLLVLGYGGTGHDGALLTDSMLVVSMLPQNHHTSLVSVPRDLWVQNPPDSGEYTKLNAVYELGSKNGKDPVAGGDAAAKKLSVVTGLNVKYWMTINFNGFRELIDAIGGVDVYVPDSFTAQYPKNDDPTVDASWIKVHFEKGNQHMNGETAIRYSRAREVLDNLAEGTDFARSARQQIIVKAVLSKVKQVSTWPSMYNAMTALEHTIYTNLSLADLAQFAMKMDMNDPQTARIGLSNANVLEDSSASGSYILRPRDGNWGLIPDYVNKHLYN